MGEILARGHSQDWLDRLDAAASAHQGWNTSQEKREVLERIRAAKAEFERRR